MVGTSSHRSRRSAPLCLAFALACVLGGAAPAWAQSARQIQASVDRDHINLDETVTLTIQASYQGRDRVLVQRPPRGDFQVVGGFSQSFTFNNQTQFTQTYRLQPTRVGTLSTPAVTLQIGGRTYHSEPIAIQVAASGSPPVATPRPTPGTGPIPVPTVPAPAPVPARPTPTTPTTPSPPVPQRPPNFPERIDPSQPFAVVTPSRQQVFVGQPLVVDYEIFEPLLGGMWDLTGVSQPTFEGFWFEAVERDMARYMRRDYNIAGNPFRSDLAMRFVVVPLESGTLEIPAFEAEVSGFFGSTQSIASQPATLNVLPLPPGAPAGFSRNNVGDYDFSVQIDPRGTRVGDPIRVTMRVSGNGLVSLVDLPEVRVQHAVVQPPVVDREQGVDHENVGGYKQIETVVIPTEEGQLTLGPFALHYFDPSVALYRTIEDPGMTLTIAGRSPTADMVLGPPIEENEGLLSSLPPPRSTEGDGDGFALPEPLVWGLGLTPPLAWLGVVVGSRIRQRRARSAPERVKRSALGRARREIRAAGGLGESDGYGQIAGAMRGYLRQRFEIKAGALTSSETSRVLRRHGVGSELADEVADLLETCEVSRFAHGQDDNGRLGDVAKRAEAAVRALEGRA